MTDIKEPKSGEVFSVGKYDARNTLKQKTWTGMIDSKFPVLESYNP